MASGSVADAPTPRRSSEAEHGVAARRLAVEAVERIETDGAYANLLLPKLLADSGLESRDRAFVTELVYGSTRMKRALDFAIARFLNRDDVEPRVRAALRVGAYQLIFLGTPAHAAVDSTVAATPKRARGFVNAILRKVAKAGPDVDWPNDAIRLSYPDWIVSSAAADLGDRSVSVLEAMNTAATVHTRPDGYRQDPASQAVAALVNVAPGALVIDLCAAPISQAAPRRLGLMVPRSSPQTSTGTAPDSFARRRSIPRPTCTRLWPMGPTRRFGPTAPTLCSSMPRVRVSVRCAGAPMPAGVSSQQLQFDLVEAAARLVKPGGQIVYSVCTLTSAETIGVDDRIAGELPNLQPRLLPEPWEPLGRGGRLLPDSFEGDGMGVFVYDVRT